jgi:hypothetical protein
MTLQATDKMRLKLKILVGERGFELPTPGPEIQGMGQVHSY